MAKLITSHDPFHVHKTIGVFVLLHYLYRFFLLFTTGSAFPEEEPAVQASICVAVHGVLSWSSLLLPLPSKRNFQGPMIWPEFRAHSITFASRHVVATIVSLNHLWPTNVWLDVVAKIALVWGTQRVASEITNRIGDREKRTTNSMP